MTKESNPLVAAAMDAMRAQVRAEMDDVVRQAKERLVQEYLAQLSPAAEAAVLRQAAANSLKKAAPAPGRRPRAAPTDDSGKDWTKERKFCTSCKKTKFVMPAETGFGLTKDRGRIRAQGWCKQCRSETNYHVKKSG